MASATLACGGGAAVAPCVRARRLVGTDGDGVDFLRIAADDAAAETRRRHRAGCGHRLILGQHAGRFIL